MDDWLSYRLSDLILFSPQAYYSMFAQYHAHVFPSHLLLVASAIAVPLLAWRSYSADRLIAAMLAVWWLWVGIAFHLQRYATINWAAMYFAALFLVQALLLIFYAARHRSQRPLPNNFASAGLFVMAMLAPLASILAGRNLNQIELVAMTPDPTAIATLAFAVSTSRWRPLLAIIPLLWCVIGAATLWALRSPETWIPIVAGVFSVGMLASRRRFAT